MYFEVKVSYTRPDETGEAKRVTEPFVVFTETFGSAEVAMIDYLDGHKGDINVKTIKVLDIYEVIEREAEHYHLCVAKYTDADDKKRTVKILLRSNSVAEANKLFKSYLDGGGYMAAEITAITLSPVVDSFEVSAEK